ncbi:MAG: hypothetical protein J6P19_05625 [Acetobacter sp.]|nr:hypothetical protein [Acetobacter sp.]
MLTKKIHKQLQKIHSTNVKVTAAKFGSPQAILNTVESLPNHGGPGALGIINYQKILIALQHGNYMPLITFYSQMQPQTWRNFFVNYYKWGQKMHMKPDITTYWSWNP